MTKHQDGVGFSSADAEILTSFALQYGRKGRLSDKQLAVAQVESLSKEVAALASTLGVVTGCCCGSDGVDWGRWPFSYRAPCTTTQKSGRQSRVLRTGLMVWRRMGSGNLPGLHGYRNGCRDLAPVTLWFTLVPAG